LLVGAYRICRAGNLVLLAVLSARQDTKLHEAVKRAKVL